LRNELWRKRPAGAPASHSETGAGFVPHLQKIPVLGKPIFYKEHYGRCHLGAEHSSGPEVKSLCIEKGFGEFPLADHQPRLVLQVIDGLEPQVNPVSMVSDA